MNSNNIIYFLLVIIIILLLILLPRPYDINNNHNIHNNNKTNKKYVIPLWHYPAYWVNPHYRRTLVIKTNNDNYLQDRKIKNLENNMTNIINKIQNSNHKTNIVSNNIVDAQGNINQDIVEQTTYEDTIPNSPQINQTNYEDTIPNSPQIDQSMYS